MDSTSVKLGLGAGFKVRTKMKMWWLGQQYHTRYLNEKLYCDSQFRNHCITIFSIWLQRKIRGKRTNSHLHQSLLREMWKQRKIRGLWPIWRGFLKSVSWISETERVIIQWTKRNTLSAAKLSQLTLPCFTLLRINQSISSAAGRRKSTIRFIKLLYLVYILY